MKETQRSLSCNDIKLKKNRRYHEELRNDELAKAKNENENENEILKRKIKELEDIICDKDNIIEEYERETKKKESHINELVSENRAYYDKIIECMLTLETKENEVLFYKDNLKRHENESAAMANRLAELKNFLIEDKICLQSFQCEKMGYFTNSKFEITFGRTVDNDFVMVLNDEGEDLEYVQIEDVEYIRQDKEIDNKVDICYNKEKKQEKFSVMMKSKVYIENFVKVFKAFQSKSILNN